MLSLLVVNSGLHSGFPDSLLSVDFSFHPFPCGIKINGVVWKLKAWVRQFITASAVQQQRHSNEWVALISLEIYGNQMVVWVNHSTEKQPGRFYLALYGWYWIFSFFQIHVMYQGAVVADAFGHNLLTIYSESAIYIACKSINLQSSRSDNHWVFWHLSVSA